VRSFRPNLLTFNRHQIFSPKAKSMLSETNAPMDNKIHSILSPLDGLQSIFSSLAMGIYGRCHKNLSTAIPVHFLNSKIKQQHFSVVFA